MAAQAPGRYPSHMTLHLDNLQEAVDLLLQRIPGTLRIGAPLGIGKPHRLLNALYQRVEKDPSRPLQIYTALSLDPPSAAPGLERRFLQPFAQRHFGDDFPALLYVQAMKRDALPAHIQVEEFYMQSGALLGSRQAQSSYTSLNYTHAADAVAEEAWGQMVSMKGTDIVRVPFEEALGELNTVPIYRYEEAAALFG